jgi:hypothetical protein
MTEASTHRSSCCETNLSTLSRQLAESAARAQTRDNSLTRRELGIEADRLHDQIAGDAYQAVKQIHNNERPETDDPELLSRAKQATEFLARSDQGARGAKSPFDGLSREQLDLIMYDDTGAYTVNERRAAWYGVFAMESQWNRQVMHLYDLEAAAHATNRPQTTAEILAHYRTLPAIEQAQYPDDYESRLQADIDRQDDSATKDIKMYSLFELLARLTQPEKLRVSDDKADISTSAGSITQKPTSIMAKN